MPPGGRGVAAGTGDTPLHILALQGTNLAHTPCEIIRKREFHLSFWEVTSNDGNQRANNNITACQAGERGKRERRRRRRRWRIGEGIVIL